MRALANLVGFVGLEAVQGELVFFGPDCDRFDTELIGSSKYPNGNFGTVCNKNFLDRQGVDLLTQFASLF